ncbi:hypothetical protein JHK87_044879 [Glycine soja]|nr:hypothetical protein JHK87_044879 [Glycine soja]
MSLKSQSLVESYNKNPRNLTSESEKLYLRINKKERESNPCALELPYAIETSTLKPSHKYVGWVVVDGEPLYECEPLPHGNLPFQWLDFQSTTIQWWPLELNYDYPDPPS